MQHYKPLSVPRHEVRLQELRLERKSEAIRLEKVKVNLMTKLQAPKGKRDNTRAA